MPEPWDHHTALDDELEMELRRANADDDPLIEELQTKIRTTEAALAESRGEVTYWRDQVKRLCDEFGLTPQLKMAADGE